MIEAQRNIAEDMTNAARAFLQLRENPNSTRAKEALQKKPASMTPKTNKARKRNKKIKVRVANENKSWALNSAVGNQQNGCSERTVMEIARILLLAAQDGALAIIATSANVALLDRPNGRTIETLSLSSVLDPQTYSELIQTAAALGTLVFEIA